MKEDETISTKTNVYNYERSDLVAALKEALKKAGLADKQLSLGDLAPLDQFHSRGLAATKELAAALQITPDTKVLDVGSGLGGPARYLAATFGCHVRGIDMTQSFVDVANYLAERVGLSDKVGFECANALALPFPEQSFDLVWTQHVAMNIEDRLGLYAEIYRVLKPGGKLAVYDVMAGDNGPVYFPVPWSTLPETSFLMTQQAMQSLLIAQGFKVLSWKDCTESAITWFTEMTKAMSEPSYTPPALSLHLAVGPDFAMRAGNLSRSLKEGRASLVEAIFERVE